MKQHNPQLTMSNDRSLCSKQGANKLAKNVFLNRLNRHGFSWLMVMLLNLFILPQSFAAILIDDFGVVQPLISASGAGSTADNLSPPGGMLGGERDIAISVSSGTTATSQVISGAFSFDLAAATTGQGDIVWDGPDGDAGAIDFTGLGGVDLTNAGTLDSLAITFDGSNHFSLITLKVYTDAGNISTVSQTLAILASSATYYVPFSLFSGGADFSNVGAVSLSLSPLPSPPLPPGTAFNMSLSNIQADSTLTATHTDALLIDNDSDGLLSPGDTLRYTTTITNTDDAANSPIAGVAYNVAVDSNASLVVGSVTTSQGSVTNGNTAGDASVTIDVGSLADAGTVTITYDILIDSSLNTAVTQISSQGTVSSNGLTGLLTDDNAVGGTSDATITPITKTTIGDFVWNDLNGNGVQDGGAEAGIAGVTLDAYYDADNSDSINGGDILLASATTDGSGAYSFGLPNYTNYIIDVTDTGNVLSGATITGGTDPKAVSVFTSTDSTDNTVDFGYSFPAADLAITNSDGVTSVVAGQALVYTIVASNNGPSDDPSVALTDTFPASLSCTYTSVAAGGASGNTASGSGNIVETLSMPVSSSVTYTVSCNINTGATGTISNTATITGSVTDSTPGNNSATDTDAVLISSDLAITNSDGVTSAVAGQALVYIIVASNNGPSDDPAVALVDTFPASLSCTYISVAAGGATGNTAVGAGNLSETLSMPVSSSVTYAVLCDIKIDATGTLSNTATISGSVTDPTPGNNSATDSDTVISHTVTFDGNTSTGGATAIQTSSSTANLTANGFTKTDYTFSGWDTISSGGGTAYADGASYPFTANITLYAQWSINSFTVTFDGNTSDGGTTAAQSGDYNVAANLTANGFTRTGYTFTGWDTVVGGGGTAYAEGASYPFTADVTLYAQWSINSHTVTFDGNTGTGTMSDQSSNYNVAANLMTNGFSKTGYTFSGWNTVSGGGGTAYAEGASYPFTADVTLYAQWTALVAPDSPNMGTATGGNTQATVSFTAPASDGGGTITGYTVTSSPSAGTDSNAGSTGLSHTITGLTNGTAYTFTVTATNVYGTSAASSASNSVTPATVPDAPTGVTAVAGTAQASVEFTAPASDGGSAITAYTVTSSPAGGTDNDADTTGLSHTITGLADGVAYTFTVTATNAEGTSVASAVSNSISPDSPPVIILPDDITIDAVGLFTAVDVGTATASDSNDGALTPSSNAPSHFAPGANTVTWSVTDAAGNIGTADQMVNVIPLISLSNDQISAEGDSASFSVILNGDAVAYPVNVPYTVSGSAATDGSDHDLIDGIATIDSGREVAIVFNTIDDGANEGIETIVVTLSNPSNAVLGNSTHTTEVIEGSVAPTVGLSASQGEGNTLILTRRGGLVTVSADISDPNAGDSHSYDWIGTDNALIDNDNVDNTFSFNPQPLSEGVYTIRLSVNDGELGDSAAISLHVIAEPTVFNPNIDSDHDGVNDPDEGDGDSNGNGIPDYLDAVPGINVLPGQKGNNEQYLIEVTPGLLPILGSTAQQSGVNRVVVTMTEIGNSGKRSDDDRYSYPNDLLDLVINGLRTTGETATFVVSLQNPIEANAIYRNLVDGIWQDFIEDANNQLFSAAGGGGHCPPPGSTDYQPGLIEGNLCIQVSLENNGPNDNDSASKVVSISGLAKDGGSSGGGGGGSANPLWLMLLAMYGFAIRKRFKH